MVSDIEQRNVWGAEIYGVRSVGGYESGRKRSTLARLCERIMALALLGWRWRL